MMQFSVVKGCILACDPPPPFEVTADESIFTLAESAYKRVRPVLASTLSVGTAVVAEPLLARSVCV